MNRTMRAEAIDRAAGRAMPGLAAAMAVLLLATGGARGQSGGEELDRPDGRRVAGRIEGDARAGFRFAPRDGGAAIPLEPGLTIRREGQGPGTDVPTSIGPPPFHLLAGPAARLSGSIRLVNQTEVRWGPDWQGGEIVLPRGCVQAIVQRPGEARVLADRFEAIDTSRWSVTGHPTIADRSGTDRDRDRGVRLPAEGASLTHELDESLAAGRLELAFHDDGTVAAGRECLVEPIFRGPTGRTAIRILLGWSEESLGVESTGGPALQVQRLARAPGWHRLTVRFGPGETEIAVDGRELAHGRQPGGPLCAIRLATRTIEPAASKAPAARFDDLRLVRFAEPPASVELDPNQDEARLVVGDQIFGQLREADADRVVMAVEGRPIPLKWGEVAGLYLRRVPAQGAPVEGLLVRAEWQAAPGDRPAPADFAEGALMAASDESLAIATPYSGTLTIPRGALRRLAVLGRGRRIVLDVAAHHLGDEPSITPPVLDPPQAEGLSLDRAVELPAAPDGPAELVLDVVQVVPEAGETDYSAQVRKGELRTYVLVNGQRVDYVNRHIRTANEAPERVRIAIPPGLLRAGKNAVRIELAGDSDPQPKYDDMGVIQIAVEFPSAAPAPPPGSRLDRPGPS